MIHQELTKDYTRQMFNSDYLLYDTEHMTEKSIKAFIELKKIGCPVRISEDYDDRGYFWIDGESEYSELFLNYYSMTLVEGSPELQNILEDNGLYFEWYNPAYACVYKD
tara:strand:- start:35 stop:361 length:327 start_codon:yes stop_codon:yes gene_type:complete